MKFWPITPNVPSAGHVTATGYWHSGDVRSCRRCDANDGHRLCRLSGAVALYDELVDEGRVRLRVEPGAEFQCRECGMPLRADARGRAPRHTARARYRR